MPSVGHVYPLASEPGDGIICVNPKKCAFPQTTGAATEGMLYCDKLRLLGHLVWPQLHLSLCNYWRNKLELFRQA